MTKNLPKITKKWRNFKKYLKFVFKITNLPPFNQNEFQKTQINVQCITKNHQNWRNFKKYLKFVFKITILPPFNQNEFQITQINGQCITKNHQNWRNFKKYCYSIKITKIPTAHIRKRLKWYHFNYFYSRLPFEFLAIEIFEFWNNISWKSETLYNDCNEGKAFDHGNCNTLPHDAVENDGSSPEKQPTVGGEWPIRRDLTMTSSFIASCNYSFRTAPSCLFCVVARFTVNECLDFRNPLAAIFWQNNQTLKYASSGQ